MKVRRTRTLSSSLLSDISVLLGGGRRHGTKTVARLELVIKFSLHLTAEKHIKSLVYTFCNVHQNASEIDWCFYICCSDSMSPPLRHFGQEVEQVVQAGGVPGRQQAGQQLQGRCPVLHVGQTLGLEQSHVELGGKQRLRQLPAKLFDESGHIVRESCGQTVLPSVQLGLKQTQGGDRTQKNEHYGAETAICVCIRV